MILDADTLRSDAVSTAAEAIRGGVRIFQYRDKRGSRRTVHDACYRLAGLLKTEGAIFIVNDYADIAAAVGADGVHLGQDDLPVGSVRKLIGPERIIGVSTHSLEEARAAEAEGADYVGFGPVFPTATKNAGSPRGIAALRKIKAQVSIPVFAIGGISFANVADTIAAGADGVASISVILSADDIRTTSREMIRIIESGRKLRK